MRDFLVSTRHFLDYTMGRNRRIATVAVFLVTLGYVASAGLAWALKLLADGMARRDQAASLLALALVIALLLASRAESFFADYVAVHQYRNAAHDLANHLLALDLTLPRVSHLEDPEYLDRYELLQGDVENLVKILWTWVRILAAGIQTALSSALLLGVHPVLALLPMAAAPVVAADARAARARDRGRLQGAADDRLEDALHRLAASPGPAKELKVSSAEQAIDTLASSAWECSTSKRVRAAARGSLLTFAAWTVFGAAQVMAAGWVGLRVIDGRARLGDILLVITLGLQARSQFGTFVWNAARGASTRLAFRRYRDLLEFHSDSTAPPDAPVPAPDRLQHGIRFEGVGFGYPGARAESLCNIDLVLPAGRTIAIVGENGAGKSTLVKLLCGLYEPTSGRILADDVDLASVVAQEWRVKVAALFQDFARLQLSCGDAIGVGDLPRHDDAFALDDAVARAGSESVIDALPDRYATQLGRHFDGGVDLSGGGWQRVALAQAMMRRTPLVLVLDEPASALDAFAEHQLFLRYAAAARRPETLHSGAITVFVSHRFSTVRMADVIVVMSGGRIAEVGDHDDLMRRRGIYADLYSAQAAAYADSGAPEDRPTQLPPVG